MPSILEEFMLQSCVITTAGEPDEWGEPSIGTAVTTPCRFWVVTQRLKLPDGELLEARAVLQVPASVTLNIGDSVTITGSDESYRVLQVVEVPDIDGAVEHKRAYLA